MSSSVSSRVPNVQGTRRSWNEEGRFWVQDPIHGYVQAQLVRAAHRAENSEIVFRKLGDVDGAGEEYSLPRAEAERLAPVSDEQLLGESNICNLSTVSEGALLSTVKARFERKEIYTNVARIVLAVNPFEDLQIYTPEFVDRYSCGGGVDSGGQNALPPHVFGIGADAFHGLMSDRTPQSVLISGESGAGKTESTKHVLSFLADVAGTYSTADEQQQSTETPLLPSGATGLAPGIAPGTTAGAAGIETKILSTNPILEAFGNAKTIRNNNSSRFGKWIKVVFGRKMEIEGAEITDYLLETTRVVSQAHEERNYHIFYQLLSHLGSTSPTSTSQRPLFTLSDSEQSRGVVPAPADYEYLRHGCVTAPFGICDESAWRETYESFLNIGFSEQTITALMKIVAAILVLGNVSFAPDATGEGSVVANEAVLRECASLLGFRDRAFAAFAECLTVKKLVVGKEVTPVLLNVEKAGAARDAVAKLFYLHLFKEIIAIMNETLVVNATHLLPTNKKTSAAKTPSTTSNNCYIGILDIAGFESFQQNSLEQLFINLSNETLQQYFNDYVFKAELADYQSENVTVTTITFSDNLDILELIQGKNGILDCLDEELNVNKATFETYAAKVNKNFEKHKRFVKNRFARPSFGVRHFAGEVEYSCNGWLEKNLDEPPREIVAIMRDQSVGNSMVAAIGHRVSSKYGYEANGASTVSASKPVMGFKARMAQSKKLTVSLQFRASLKKLIEEVRSTDPHFIRCIKPNAEKMAAKFDGKAVMEQLLNSGAMEAVKIRQSGYPFRLTFVEFLRRFYCIFPRKIRAKVLLKSCTSSAEVAMENQNASLESKISLKSVLKQITEKGEAGGREKMQEFVEYLPMLVGRADCTAKDFVVGKTKLFMKLPAQRGLLYQKNLALANYAITLQRNYRGHRVRKTTRKVFACSREIAEFLAKMDGAYGIRVAERLADRAGDKKSSTDGSAGGLAKKFNPPARISTAKAACSAEDAGTCSAPVEVVPAAVSVLQLLGGGKSECDEIEVLRSHHAWCVGKIEYAHQKLDLLPKNLRLVEEIAPQLQAEIGLLEFMASGGFAKTEDITLLDRYVAQAKHLSGLEGFWERRRPIANVPSGPPCQGDLLGAARCPSIAETLSLRIEAVTTQLPLLEALAGCLAEEDASEIDRVLKGVETADARLMEEGAAGGGGTYWIRAEGPSLLLAAQQRLADLGGWPPKKVEEETSEELSGSLSTTLDHGAGSQSDSASSSAVENVPTPQKRGDHKKSRKMTITGMVEAEVEELKKELYNAKLTYDCPKLGLLLQKATSKGLRTDEIVPYHQLYQKLCTSEYVVSLLTHVSKGLLVEGATSTSASCDPSSPGGDHGLANGKQFDRRRSVFMQPNLPDAELKLALREFGNLYNYPGLREKKPIVDAKTGRDLFLEHNKQRLRSPLTLHVPDKHVGTVLQNFRNVLLRDLDRRTGSEWIRYIICGMEYGWRGHRELQH
eukprot:g2847.t1